MTAFRPDNLVKRIVFCYPSAIVGEFPLECKNDNINNNDNNDDKQSSHVYKPAGKPNFSFQPKCLVFS